MNQSDFYMMPQWYGDAYLNDSSQIAVLANGAWNRITAGDLARNLQRIAASSNGPGVPQWYAGGSIPSDFGIQIGGAYGTPYRMLMEDFYRYIAERLKRDAEAEKASVVVVPKPTPPANSGKEWDDQVDDAIRVMRNVA